MAKNAEQIKALRAQIAAFNDKMDALKKKKGKEKDEDMMDDEEYAQLAAEVAEISDKVSVLENEDKAAELADEKTTKELSELRAELARRDEADKKRDAETKELAEKMARIEKADRDSKVGERVKSCRVPAFRNGLNALYAYALEHSATVKVYSQDKEGKQVTEEKTLTDVVDAFVSEINAQSEKLFKALAFSGQKPREEGAADEESAGVTVQKRVQELRAKHPDAKQYSQYESAMQEVLRSDPDLAQRYRAELGRENA